MDVKSVRHALHGVDVRVHMSSLHCTHRHGGRAVYLALRQPNYMALLDLSTGGGCLKAQGLSLLENLHAAEAHLLDQSRVLILHENCHTYRGLLMHMVGSVVFCRYSLYRISGSLHPRSVQALVPPVQYAPPILSRLFGMDIATLRRTKIINDPNIWGFKVVREQQ